MGIFQHGIKFSSYINHCSVLTRRLSTQMIGVLGVPFFKGQGRQGVEEGADALREAGLIKELIAIGHNVKDYGNVTYEERGLRPDVPDKIKWLPDVASCTEQVSKLVQNIMYENRKVLTLGGDHSIVLGSVDGHIQAKKDKQDVCVLWVDAHADVNTADTSETGSLHGMTVALLVEELYNYWPYLPGLDWQKPMMSIKNLAYIGLRSVDDYERLIIEKFGVAAFGMEDIEQFGIHEVTRLALEKINPKGKNSLHVSFDIDALDSLEAPCTGTPVRGGLTLREALHIMEVAQRSGTLSAVDIVEINPKLGSPTEKKITLEAGIHVAKAAFAHSRSGSVPNHVKHLPGFYAPITGSK